MKPAARCAADDDASRGRRHREPHAAEMRAYDLDRHRIVHCTAFRRLEYKTQVYVSRERDHYRTRLTHTLEVAANAARLARALGVHETLAETVALAHDLGHPPFGHAGEAALAACMADHGGFEHNLQSFRVVDYLEHPYPDFRGLNLSFEARESLVKHRTRFDAPAGDPMDEALVELMAAGPMPTLEAQVANLADEMAYTLHDVEDGLLAGLIDEAALRQSELWRGAMSPWRERFPDAHVNALRRPVLEALADALVADAVCETRARLEASAVADVAAVRQHAEPLVAFSAAMRARLDELQDFLYRSVYRHETVRRMDDDARGCIRDVFNAYAAKPDLLPERFARRIDEQGVHRVVCDYVAGMTDRFCRNEHARRAV